MNLFKKNTVALFFLFLLAASSYCYSQHSTLEKKGRYSYKNPALFPISDNQKSYDIKFYDLNFDFNLSDTTFRCIAKIDLTVENQVLSYIHLDLASKSIFKRDANHVDSVVILDKKTAFTHNDTTLIINLERNYSLNEKISLTVYYRCKIDNFYLMLFNKFGRSLLFNLSEPFGARFWFPCKDYPEDKADSVRMTITVPDNYYAVSNGKLQGISELNGKKTFRWMEKYPIATYLISIAAYPYILFEEKYLSQSGKSIDINNYVMPEDTAAFGKVRASVHKIMRYFEKMFGEYPFAEEKYAHAQIAFSGGMENQTATSIGLWNEYLITHELAHSWFGNSVTCKDFHNIWLNEGFATYSTALYMESEISKSEFNREMNARKYFGNGKIYRDELYDDMSVFNEGLVYSKASWVLHMLRGIMGDEKFFTVIRNYYNSYKYQVAAEDDFRNECEKLYGNSLKWFFDRWIHGEYYPYYQYEWSQKTNAGKIKLDLQIEQLQTAQIFKMPIGLTFYSGSWDTTITVWDSLKIQSFSFAFNISIDSVILDKNNYILKKVYSSTTGLSASETDYEFKLYQNYPNPFNSSTKIKFTLPAAGHVKIKVYDILGREVKTLLDRYCAEGFNNINLDAKDFASGIYYYRIEIGKYCEIRKMILIR